MSLIKTIKSIFYILRLAECSSFVILSLLNCSLTGIKDSVLVVIFINVLFDWVQNKINFSTIALMIFFVALTYILIIMFAKWFENYYKPSTIPAIQKKLLKKLYNKSIEVDVENFDNPEFYDNFIWSMQQMDSGAIAVIDDMCNLLRNIIISVSIFGILLTINYIILITIFFSVGVTVFLYYFIIRINFQKEVAINSYRRKSDYFKRIFYLKEYAKELRITNISRLILNKFDENEANIRSILLKYGKKLQLVNTLNGITISTLLDTGLILILSYQLFVTKSITIGQFTASSYAIWFLFSSLNGLMFGINRFPEHALRINKTATFLRSKSNMMSSANANENSDNVSADLELRNVCFEYTRGGKKILKNINMTIKKGDKIAIVGENGAGKSTLIKLILRLYNPTSGNIYYNNINVTDLDIGNYRKNFSTVFQDYKIFAATLGQNVTLDLEYNTEQVNNALEKSLFYSDESLKAINLNSSLTKEFEKDGINLSGGQTQKLAVARSFLDKNIIILDEPSSSLDVISEYELNKVITEETGGEEHNNYFT